MNFILTRPLVFIDLETTGVDINHDRIVQIAILKVFPNGTQERTAYEDKEGNITYPISNNIVSFTTETQKAQRRKEPQWHKGHKETIIKI